MSELILRKATDEDCVWLFELVNNSLVRKNSKNSGVIFWDDHVKWFNSRLSSSSTFMYIGYDKSERIGQIRFDLDNGNWLIDYSIVPEKRGKGFGSIIIKKGVETLLTELIEKPVSIIEEVLDFNISSKRVFEKCGFELVNQQVFTGTNMFTYRLKII